MELNLETAELFIVFVVPGLVAVSVYGLLMPARRIDWREGVLQGMFYSSINFVVLLPLIHYAALPQIREDQPFATWGFALLILIILPGSWPLLLRAAFRSQWLATRIQIPFPTAYAFHRREPAFVLVHLRNGELIAGYWGPRSYAGTFPNDGDIFLEGVYEVNERGEIRDPIPATKGVLLRKDEYVYLELFDVPNAA